MSRRTIVPPVWVVAVVASLWAALAGCNARTESQATITVPTAQAPAAAVASLPVAPPQLLPTPAPKPVAEVLPFRVYELAGSASEIGSQHGRFMGDDIRALHADYIKAYFKNDTRRFLAMAAATAFESLMRPEHREELDSLAHETAVDSRQMTLAQCFLDLSAGTACSTVALPSEASPDGVARFGRNLDFPGFNLAEDQTVLLVYHPAGRNAFATVGWPGLIGVLSGMNEHGLTLANMEVKRDRRLPSAMPYTLLYRTVLENCRTVDEAIALLEKTPRQTANNLMLMDATGNRAVAEITPDKVTVRRGEPGRALLSTNNQRGNGPDCDQTGICARYDRLRRTTDRYFGRIDEKSIERMLASVAQGKYTLQSMVFEPSNRVIYLAAGRNAPSGAFYRIDLTKYF